MASSTGKSPYLVVFGQLPRMTALPKATTSTSSPLTPLTSGNQQISQLGAFAEVSRFHVPSTADTSLLIAALHSCDLSIFSARVRQAAPSRVERLLPEWIAHTLQSAPAQAWQPPDSDWRQIRDDLESASADSPKAIAFTARHVCLLLFWHHIVLAVMDTALGVSIPLADPSNKVTMLSWSVAVVLTIDSRHESVCLTHEGELRQVLSMETCASLFKVACPLVSVVGASCFESLTA